MSDFYLYQLLYYLQAKHLIQMVIAGGQVVARALSKAVSEEWQASKRNRQLYEQLMHEAQREEMARLNPMLRVQRDTRAATDPRTKQKLLRRTLADMHHQGLGVRDSLQIVNLEPADLTDPEKIRARLDHMKVQLDPSQHPGSSEYLHYKVIILSVWVSVCNLLLYYTF